MYVFTLTDPNRDGTMENDIVIHEMGHGITNRMTGGGTANCLQTYESAGMGEGWGDSLAKYVIRLGCLSNLSSSLREQLVPSKAKLDGFQPGNICNEQPGRYQINAILRRSRGQHS
jgi:extracellular elastinolytic metalloproteinase